MTIRSKPATNCFLSPTRTSSTSWGSCSLPGLGDLRPPREGVAEVPAGLARLGLLDLGLDRPPHLLGQPDLQQLPLRRRVVAAHHDNVGENLVERRALVAFG